MNEVEEHIGHNSPKDFPFACDEFQTEHSEA